MEKYMPEDEKKTEELSNEDARKLKTQAIYWLCGIMFVLWVVFGVVSKWLEETFGIIIY